MALHNAPRRSATHFVELFLLPLGRRPWPRGRLPWVARRHKPRIIRYSHEHPGPAHDGCAQRRCRRMCGHSYPSIYDDFVATCLSSAGRPGRPRRRRRLSWRKPRTTRPKRSAQQALSSSRPRPLRRLPRSGAGTRATTPCPRRPGGGGEVLSQEVLHQGVELEQHQGQARRLPGLAEAAGDLKK